MTSKYEIYDINKTYIKPSGEIYTNDLFIKEYPAAQITKYALWVMGEVIIEAFPLSYIRGINKIPNSVSDEESIIIATNNRILKEEENSPIERIASALEFIELLLYKGGI